VLVCYRGLGQATARSDEGVQRSLLFGGFARAVQQEIDVVDKGNRGFLVASPPGGKFKAQVFFA
jgi:hypothetical protein